METRDSQTRSLFLSSSEKNINERLSWMQKSFTHHIPEIRKGKDKHKELPTGAVQASGSL